MCREKRELACENFNSCYCRAFPLYTSYLLLRAFFIFHYLLRLISFIIIFAIHPSANMQVFFSLFGGLQNKIFACRQPRPRNLGFFYSYGNTPSETILLWKWAGKFPETPAVHYFHNRRQIRTAYSHHVNRQT